MEEKDPKKQELDFVYDEDLLPVLEKIGIKNDFLAGKIKCHFCNAVVTEENLYSFFLEEGSVKMVCDKPDCIEKLKERTR